MTRKRQYELNGSERVSCAKTNRNNFNGSERTLCNTMEKARHSYGFEWNEITRWNENKIVYPFTP